MTNGTKITIVIAVIITLSIVVYEKVNNKSKKEENNINSDILQYFNGFENNDIEENVISNELNETVDNTEKNENTIKNEVSDNKTTVIGKEEQESSKENTAISDEQKAIEIAKNEWAISVDSYDYRAELQSDGTYVVRVIGKTDRNEVTRYIVNVKTGVATEVQ